MRDDKVAVVQGGGVNRRQQPDLRERLQTHRRTINLQQDVRV